MIKFFQSKQNIGPEGAEGVHKTVSSEGPVGGEKTNVHGREFC
jgi:hypothetical protein